ncbi:hypothetical protein BGX27_000339 [Mortierella sp. AM989]|nr:hypothetical protein BGX27_000339 [Mortierella sp. AM989]
MSGCRVSLEASYSDDILYVDRPFCEKLLRAPVKQSGHDTDSVYDQQDNETSTEETMEVLSINEAAMTTNGKLTMAQISGMEYENNTAIVLEKVDYSSAAGPENACSIVAAFVEGDGLQLNISPAPTSETLSVLEPELSTTRNESDHVEDVLATLQLAISIPLPASPITSGPNFSETIEIPLASLPFLMTQPFNKVSSPSVTGVGLQDQHAEMQESCLSRTEKGSIESSEQQQQQQDTLILKGVGDVDQNRVDNNDDIDGNDNDEYIINNIPVKRRAPSNRRTDDDEDEGGERGTAIVLESTFHRLFELANLSNTTSVGVGETSTESALAGSLGINFSTLRPPHEIVVEKNETSTVDQNIDNGISGSVITDSQDDLRRTCFILESSGFDPDENIAPRSGSISPVHSSLPSSSAPSASSTSAPFLVLKSPKQRPYSQFQSRLIINGTEPSDQSISQQQRQLSRSRSLPSSPCSPKSLRSVSQQLGSRTPFSFARGETESKKTVIDDEQQNQEQAKMASALSSHQPLPSPIQTTDALDEQSSAVPLASTIGPQIQTPASSERPRRQSLLSPRQFEMMNQQNGNPPSLEGGTSGKKGGFGNFLKDHAKRSKNKNGMDAHAFSNSSESSQKQKKCRPQKKQRGSVNNTPTISFQPHSTEISTDRPSVSGRLVLHIPRLNGFKFHFVSLALHLRLKESISWTKQDLVSFDIERHHWAQIVWDKKMMLPFQDRQVEEGGENGFATGVRKDLSPAAAVAAAVSASASASPTLENGPRQSSLESKVNTTAPLAVPSGSAATAAMTTSATGVVHQTSSSSMKSGNHGNNSSPASMDTWRWEWLLPVSKSEVRPESFEGTLGMVWYELEAKCLFRWDRIGKNGQVIKSNELKSSNSLLDGPMDEKSSANRGIGSNKLLKGLGASTNKSIAQVFGKLRVGNKKKPQLEGDCFNLNTKHEEYIRESLKKSKEAQENTANQHNQVEAGDDHDDSANPDDAVDTENGSTADPNAIKAQPHSSANPKPFLIRKTLKLYFSKPPPRTSSNPAFFLPPPSMSLPNLPSTRRLKAIIPGAKIQVQIQVPSIIPIPGYAQSSRLMPCSKTGMLTEVKKNHSKDDGGNLGEKSVYSLVGKKNKSRPANLGQQTQQQQQQEEARYPNNFQAALTIRKVTKQDINSNEILRRRYENAQIAADAVNSRMANHHHHQNGIGGISPKPSIRKRLLSHQSNLCPSNWSNTTGNGEQGDLLNPGTGQDQRPRQDNRAWRKEIHVQKVKCEFWQKETCRIPLNDVPPRSVKVPLGPVFTYSDKVHKGPPSRFGAGSGSIGDVGRMGSAGSTGSATQSHGVTHSQAPSNQPFTLLIPVPLDSSKIRQTFSWPSSETPSPIAPPGYDYSVPRGTHGGYGVESSGVEFGSEMEYQSQSTANDVGSFLGNVNEIGRSGNGVGGGGTHGSSNNGLSIALPVKARIEVQHYLVFRLSIDMLEFEGEYERDEGEEFDMNGGAHEEHSIYNGGDGSSPMITPSVSIASHINLPLAPSPITSTSVLCGQTGNNSMVPSPTSPTDGPRFGAGGLAPPTTIGLAARASPMSKGHLGCNGATLASTAGATAGTGGLSTIEPALDFLDSAASLLEMNNMGEPGSSPDPASISMAYDLLKRRGSKASEGTFKNSNSVHGGSLSQQTLINSGDDVSPTQNLLSSNEGGVGASGGSSGSGGGDGGGGLISGAIGAIKKKASGSALSNNHYQQQQRQQRQHHHNGRNVSVKKLKDFVIRVPITISVQVDERGQVTSAYGRINSNENTGNEANKSFPSDVNSMADMGGNNDVRFQHESSRGNVTTTATMTTTNIVTGSSGQMYGSVEGTETFSSMSSMVASAGSESVMKRMMDDFSNTPSSALMFAGKKHSQNRDPCASVTSSNLAHHNPQQQHLLFPSLLMGGLIPGFNCPDAPSAIQSDDNRGGRKEIHANYDDDEEEGDFMVVDAEEMVEDDIEGVLSTHGKTVLERIRHL